MSNYQAIYEEKINKDKDLVEICNAHGLISNSPLLDEEELQILHNKIKNPKKFLQTKYDKYFEQICQKSQNSEPSIGDLMLEFYLMKNTITPDFVFTLTDAFTFDSLVLDQKLQKFQDQSSSKLFLIQPQKIEAIHQISKHVRKYAFVGEVTMNQIDISQKIMILDHYLFHATEYFGQETIVFGVLIVNGANNIEFVRLTLSMIPLNSMIGKALKDNRLIILRSTSEPSSLLQMLNFANLFKTCNYFEDVFPTKIADDKKLKECLLKVKEIRNRPTWLVDDVISGKNSIVNELKVILADEKASLLDDYNIPSFKLFSSLDFKNQEYCSLKEKLPITIKQQEQIKIYPKKQKECWQNPFQKESDEKKIISIESSVPKAKMLINLQQLYKKPPSKQEVRQICQKRKVFLSMKKID